MSGNGFRGFVFRVSFGVCLGACVVSGVEMIQTANAGNAWWALGHGLAAFGFAVLAQSSWRRARGSHD